VHCVSVMQAAGWQPATQRRLSTGAQDAILPHICSPASVIRFRKMHSYGFLALALTLPAFGQTKFDAAAVERGRSEFPKP